jgi:hypothetical protein
MAAVFQPQSRRSPPGILQNFRALGNHRLAHIDFGHFAAQGTETAFDVSKDFVVAPKLAIEKFRDGFARKVVLGGP